MATLTKSVRTIRTDNAGYYTYKCDVIENSYNVTSNTSNVTVTFSIKGPWSTPAFYEWNTYYGIIVDGAVKKTGNDSPYVSGSYVKLLTWTGDVSHNSDGSKSISISVYLHNGTSGYLPTQYTSSSPLSMGSVTLTTIPRASSITSAGNVTLGNQCSIRWTPASTSFKYKIKFALGSWSYTTNYVSPGTTSAYTYTGYTIPNTLALLDDIPNSTTGTMTATLYTYNSSNTQIGSTSSKTFTVTVPNTVVPTVGTITLDPVDINSQNILVQGKNKLTISVSGCSAGTGSSIKSYTFSGPGISSTTTSTSVTSGSTISNTGKLTYTVTVTDNRGRTTSKPATIPCEAWSAPSITLNSVYRVATSTGTTENDSGTYVRCTYNLSYALVNSTNDVTVKIYYKKNSASTWSSVTVLTDSKSTSGSYTLSNIDAASTYTVYATITDNYSGSSNSNSVTVFSAERILNIRPKGAGMAFGKMADTDNVLDSKWPIRSDKPEQTMSNLSFRGTQAIAGTANDTTANWAEQGNLATTYYNTTGQITDQPSQYGFLLNLTNGSNVHHIWTTQSSGNMCHRGGNANGWNGTWKTILDSANYKSYTFVAPKTLYNSIGTYGPITLSSSAIDFTYLEVFYMNNNSSEVQSVKVYSPNGKTIELTCIEPSSTSGVAYIRTSLWTISGTALTHSASKYIKLTTNQYPSVADNTQYIKIVRVIGYAQ